MTKVTNLRSAKNGDYNTPRVLSSFGQRSFSVSGPDAWSSLSRELRGIAVAFTFKRHLKAELFSRAYGVSLADSSVTVCSKPYDIFERGVLLTVTLPVSCSF